MFVLGLQGSPRRKGNTAYLLGKFLREAESYGARTRILEVCRKNIIPCKELVVCEKKGTCPIDDDMGAEIYGLLRRADVVVAASPVFFYNVTAQLKALIDRCQTLWARKYRLGLKDPGSPMRQGFLLAVGATRGKQLFDGIELTARYFFDALAAAPAGGLTYAGIEHPGDMAKHSRVAEDIRETVATLLAPFAQRKRVLFLGHGGDGRAPMAAAFARYAGGDRFDVRCAGASPASALNKGAVAAMARKGLDLAFGRPNAIVEDLPEGTADLVVMMEKGPMPSDLNDCPSVTWNLPAPAEKDADGWQTLCDDMEQRVATLLTEHRAPTPNIDSH